MKTYNEEDLKRIDEALQTLLESFAGFRNDMRSEFKALNTRLDGMLDKEEE